MSRGKKAIFNIAMNFAEEIVAVICGFILPRLILSTFGSDVYGLTNSISQFLSFAVLLRSGIGGATRAALYKPLAENNTEERDSIIKATALYMQKIGLILAGLIVLFAAIYPIFVVGEFDWIFTFSLFIIIGVSTFAESFFGITYLILLQADQRVWVSTILKIICYVFNTVISVILINAGYSIHIVKAGSALVYVLYPIILSFYVKRHYHINKNVKPNNEAIAQRWDAFWQQAAVFVMNNTDIMVLTIFSNLLEVSVYSVYNLVVNGLKRVITSIANVLEAPFGDMIAKGEMENVRSNLRISELLMQGLCTIIYVTAALLIIPFVTLYTEGIEDINYIRPLFAYIILLAQFFNGVRIPYQSITQAAGRYKETRNGAIAEPILNISISVVLVINFGLVGVAVGTLVATIFRTIQYSYYVSKHIVNRSQLITLGHLAVSCMEAVLIIIIVNLIHLPTPVTYFNWFLNAVIIGCVSVIIVILGSIIFYNKDFKLSIKKLKGIISK